MTEPHHGPRPPLAREKFLADMLAKIAAPVTRAQALRSYSAAYSGGPKGAERSFEKAWGALRDRGALIPQQPDVVRGGTWRVDMAKIYRPAVPATGPRVTRPGPIPAAPSPLLDRTLEAPAFTPASDYPLGGALIGPAWRKVWAELSDGLPAEPDLLVDLMRTVAQISHKTAVELLRKGRQFGHLEAGYGGRGGNTLIWYRRIR